MDPTVMRDNNKPINGKITNSVSVLSVHYYNVGGRWTGNLESIFGVVCINAGYGMSYRYNDRDT